MLQPSQFPKNIYHGTNVAMKPGDKILPGDVTGTSVHTGFVGSRGQRAQDHAFASDDERSAWSYGEMASDRKGGRSRVYRLEPHPDMARGTEDPTEWVAPHYTVAQEVGIKPTSEYSTDFERRAGRQGTIPGYDWSTAHRDMKWRGNRPVDHEVINHPQPPRSSYDSGAHSSWLLQNYQFDSSEQHPGQQALFSPPEKSA